MKVLAKASMNEKLSKNRNIRALEPAEPTAEPAPRREKIDEPFTVLVILLLAVGLICLFSASYSVGYHYHDGDSTHFAFRQAAFAIGGIVAMFIASKFNYQKLHYIAVPLMAFTLILMSSIKWLPSIWQTINQATRWVKIGSASFTVQPSEIAKFAIIVFFSSFATIWGPKKMKTIKYGVAPFVAIIGLMALMLKWEKHLSGTVIIGVIGIVLMFLGGTRVHYLVAGGGAGVFGVVAYIMANPYAMTRINVWLDPFIDLQDKGWQGAQSLMAIGSGGLWGLGLGQGRQKHLYIPEPANDFIFPVICEELGFVGATLIIIIFAALICRGYYIAFNAEDKFGTLLAAGITTQIAIQVIMNLFVVTGLMPVTGVSLPFFSYGGTSLLMLLGEVGILLSVSRGMRVREK